jgi:hypothetical protein
MPRSRRLALICLLTLIAFLATLEDGWDAR